MSGFWFFTLVRIRLEIGLVVLGRFVRDDGRTLGLGSVFELGSQALAISGFIVDHRDVLGFQRIHRKAAQCLALCHVVGNHAVGGPKAGAGVVRVGSRRRNLRNAGVVVDFRGRDGGAGIQVAHTGHFRVDQTLCHGGGGFGIGLIIFGNQFQLDLLPPISTPASFSSSDCQTRAVSLSLPRWAIELVSGAMWPILITGRAWRQGGGGQRRRQRVFLPSCHRQPGWRLQLQSQRQASKSHDESSGCE